MYTTGNPSLLDTPVNKQTRHDLERLLEENHDAFVELPTSHYNKNILVMVDHLTRWPITKAIPNKEATTVANAIFEKLILEHGTPAVLSNNSKEFTNDTLAYVYQEFNIDQYYTTLTCPGQMEKQRTSIRF